MEKNIDKADNKKPYIEVWEDLVSIKDLSISLVVSSVMSLGGYLIAPDDSTKPLIFGLSGAVIGFIITSIWIEPKRTFIFDDEEEE